MKSLESCLIFAVKATGSELKISRDSWKKGFLYAHAKTAKQKRKITILIVKQLSNKGRFKFCHSFHLLIGFVASEVGEIAVAWWRPE